MQAVACPLCGARIGQFLRAVANRDPMTERAFPSVSVSVCRSCGLIHQNPRMSRRKVIEHYATLEDKPGGGVTRDESRSRLAALRLLKSPPSRILEVGSSDGTFLGLAREAGYDASGLEPSRTNLRRARAGHRGIAFHEGFLEGFRTAERFDVICHFYVLEYSFDPRRFLAAARRLLRPDGVMLLEVPDAEAFARLPFAASLFTHQDISIFTRRTLNAILRTAGFVPMARRLGRASKSYGLRAAAKPGPVAARGRAHFRHGLAAMNRYFRRQDAMIARVGRRIGAFHAALLNSKGPVVIFGAGENGRMVTNAWPGREGREMFFCDNNAALHGRKVDGFKVVAPSRVPRLRPALVIAASIDYQDDMVRQMRAVGVPRERIVKLYHGI